MKKSILIIASAVCIYSFSSCQSKNESESSAAGTDSSMMTTPATSGTGDPSMVKPDSLVNPSATDNTSVSAGDNTSVPKPDPAKKGKKGRVILNMDESNGMGNTEEMDAEGYYTSIYPVYPGGNKALTNFFEKNIQYPQEASDNGMEGKVMISFTVDEKGKIGSPKVTSPKLGYGIEEEAIRVFKKMPSWAPGSLKGKNVKTRYNLPVRFQLES